MFKFGEQSSSNTGQARTGCAGQTHNNTPQGMRAKWLLITSGTDEDEN